MTVKLKAKNTLRQIRENNGYSQFDMASLISIISGNKMSYSKYQKIEQGRYAIDGAEAIAITQILKAKLPELWTKHSE